LSIKGKINLVFNIFLICFSLGEYGQITQISTGTNQKLFDLSVANKNIIVGGWMGYLVKSTNECNTLTPLAVPNTTDYATKIQRIDSNDIFLVSYTPSQTNFYKSTDQGNNWVQKSSLQGSNERSFSFFDSLAGFMSNGPFLSKTNNGGVSWTNVTPPFSISVTFLKAYNDSVMCMGGQVATGGGLKLSKDKGNTWAFGWGAFGNIKITDCFFLNKDTIFGVTLGGAFTKTTDGGNNWDSSSEPPIYNSYAVYFKQANEGYVVGMNSQNQGVVLKTTDLGLNWQTFNTGITTALLNIAFLNDSIALLTGTNGLLLRWNYKKTLFTGVKDHTSKDVGIKIFPNPIENKIYIEHKTNLQIDRLSVYNTLGQVVYEILNPSLTQGIDLTFLESGLYYVRLSNKSGVTCVKVIKE
jgi:photosystem II stability/assembly factor-like uncharacterized protein